MSGNLSAKVLPKVLKFVGSKPVSAIKDGLLFTMPLTIIGSIFLLLAALPINNYSAIMTNFLGAGWDKILWQVVGSTFDLMALVGVFGIAYTYTKNEGYDGVSAGILGMVSFFIVNAHFMKNNDTIINGVIPKLYLGGKGIIGAIIVGLLVGYIFSLTLRKNLKITLPEGVPEGVSKTFVALIPGFFIITFFALVYLFFDKVFNATFLDIIYKTLQTPIQGLSSSLGAAIIICVLISFLWWCGIHGSAIMSGIMGPILTANAIANQEILNSGVKLVAGENAKIVTSQFIDQFITVTGSGLTLGLVLAMLFAAKSAQLKELGKMSIGPGIFNINEPVIFGTPIVFNPIMFIPFIGAPVASALIVYTSIRVGLVAPFGSILVPWTTPPIVGGFLIGGVRAAILQLVIICVSFAIYFPFMKIQDKINLKQEKGGN
ncbi:MAG: PTS sugar transporter subunit IIC [Fusobacteriaceae bacterium]